MTLITYTSDLTDLFLFESTSDVSAFGGGGAGLTAETDLAMEGTNAVDKQVTQSADKGFLWTDTGGNFSIGVDDHFFIWIYSAIFGINDTRDNHGISVCIGDGTSAFVKFHVDGIDTLPLGGGKPYAIRFVETALANLRTLVGTPSATPDSIGGGLNVTGNAKDVNLGVDGARIGTGYDILNGTGGDPEGDFAGIASDDESTAEGIFQTVPGGFNLQGKLRFGASGTPCEFLDSNTNIFLIDTIHSLTDFTEFLIEHASSIITLTNINILALGTNNPGRFEMVTSAAVCVFVNVGFIDFGVTILGTGADFNGCRWINSDTVTGNGAKLLNSSILTPVVAAGAGALVYNETADPDGELDGMTFSQGGNAHSAIEFGTAVTSNITLRGIDFTGFGSTDDVDGAVFKFLATGGSLNLNLVGCTTDGTFSVDDTAGIAVTVVIDPVTTLVNVKDNDAVNLSGARVLLEASDDSGDFEHETIVTITRSGSVATVAHTAHPYAVNDIIVIRGADQQEYNGPFTITGINTNDYDYTVSGSPTSPATGTIDSTGAILNGTTDGSGNISASRTFSASQPVKGFVRSSTSSPRFKSFSLAGTVDNADGLTINVRMILDE